MCFEIFQLTMKVLSAIARQLFFDGVVFWNEMCHVVKQATRRPIYLTLLNGTGYVFDAEDYMELRRRHHIVGAMVGTRWIRGCDSAMNTLPAELATWETQLLVDERIAVLVSKQRSLLRAPKLSTIAEYERYRDEEYDEQVELQLTQRLRDFEYNMDDILYGKRRKIDELGHYDCCLDYALRPEDVVFDALDIVRETTETFMFDFRKACFELPCAHRLKHRAQIVRLPADHSLKYSVYRDLWARGYFVTAGDYFGADFLIYPGDPLLFHASHIVILLPEPHIFGLELISKVRMTVMVHKACLLAFFVAGEVGRDGRTKLHYQTFNWDGEMEELDDDDDFIDLYDEEYSDEMTYCRDLLP